MLIYYKYGKMDPKLLWVTFNLGALVTACFGGFILFGPCFGGFFLFGPDKIGNLAMVFG